MDDVKDPNVPSAEDSTPSTTEAPAENEPAVQTSQSDEQTSAPDLQIKRTVPYERFSEINSKYKETQRRLAELEGNQQLQAYDPNDLENVVGHPFVQELLLKDAKRELTDYARTTLDEYPNLHPSVKKAILSNARGFVNENTRDVETGKLDLLEYIESVAEEAQAQSTPTPKTFPIASTNVSKTDQPGVRPADVSKILEKPVDEWTEEDASIVNSYKKSSR